MKQFLEYISEELTINQVTAITRNISPYIDHALKKYGFKKIYIATDDENILKGFLSRYSQEIVIYDKDTARSNGLKGVHTRTDIVRPYHKYKLGIEVICDMCILAACGGLISGLSQVSLISRIYKKSKNEHFRYDKIIDKGIHKHGKIFGTDFFIRN